MNYKYAIQKVEQRVNGYYYSDIELSNGEIINDVRMKLSENPYEVIIFVVIIIQQNHLKRLQILRAL